MNLFKKAKTTSIVLALLYIAFGIFLICAPNSAVALICYLLGALIIISGICETVNYFIYGYQPFGFVSGLLEIMFGIVIAVVTPVIVSSAVFPVVIGLVFLIKSILLMQDSFDYRRAGIKTWWLDLAFAIVMLAFGIILLINPFGGNASKTLFLFIGISMIFSGISTLASTLFISSKAKKIRKSFKEAFGAVTYEIKDADETTSESVNNETDN